MSRLRDDVNSRAYASVAIRGRWNLARSRLDGAVGIVDRAGGPVDRELRASMQLVRRYRRTFGFDYVEYGDEARAITLRYGWRY